MTINRLLTPFAFVAALALASAPAFAQQHRNERGRSSGHAQGRSYSGSGYRGGVVGHGAPRVYSARPYYGRPYYVRPYYARPYYAFRPHVSLGFGIWLGYPVAYPPYYATPYPAYPYPAYPSTDPYGYQASPSYGAPAYPSNGYPQNSYPQNTYPQNGTTQPSSNRGGISFEITPQDAAIYVDGSYIGTAGEFGPDQRPLDLSAGRHRVEIRAQGYRVMSFDADVRAGQVLPYQGTLEQD
jgi:hypothetical protein